VEKFLIVGVETVAGANLAAFLVDHAEVFGLAVNSSIQIAGCDTDTIGPDDHTGAGALLADSQPTHIIYCGPASRSSWSDNFAAEVDGHLATRAAGWATAAQKAGAAFTYLSSDAVFTGPFLFHQEEGPGLCPSIKAGLLRAAEEAVIKAHPEALVARTNVFGWSSLGEDWVESRLNEIESRRIVDQDWIRHSTPILATDLAGILQRAWEEKLSGIYHVAGAERVNPLKFAQRLADHFDLPWLSLRREELLMDVASEFAAGECSLQTKKLRKALCVAMPMISERLARLHEQSGNGFRERITQPATTRATRVA